MIELKANYLISLRALASTRLPAQSATSLPGGLVTRRRGRGLETADLRAFTHGDDPRHIDRNATARLGQPHVRTFHAERDRTTVLIADFRPSMFWGTRRTLRSIAAAEALCLIGWRAVQSGGRVGVIALTATGPEFAPPRGRDRGMTQAIGCMVIAHALASERVDLSDPNLDQVLPMARRISPRGAEVILASGFDTLGPKFAEEAKVLAQRRSLSLLHVTDGLETDPKPGSYWLRHPDGSLHRAEIGTPKPDTYTDMPLDLQLRSYSTALAPDQQMHFA
jgi:uncharacterized protein (DUF58 family)